MALTRRHLSLAATVIAATLLAGCAGMASLTAEVATFGEWPAGRAPGRYAFERLPSQQARAEQQQALEEAARPALAAAGFVPAASTDTADVVVQLGARITRQERSPWDDPLWWRGGFGLWQARPWHGSVWGGTWVRVDTQPRYEREVALLLRDRASGQPLYEARASSDGLSSGSPDVLGAMLRAALAEFPKANGKPHPVTAAISPVTPSK